MRNVKEILIINVKHRLYDNSLFPATITGWIDLNYSLSNAPSINVFKQNILKFILLGPNNIHNLHGRKLLTRLRLV